MTRVFRLPADEREAWRSPIAALEALASYPLGTDRFRIDHGTDYFAFFDRLGDVAYYLAADDGELLAVGCGMLRELPGFGAAWYVADLKVHPDRRGEHLPLRMLAAAFPAEYPRCPRGYGISMNPPRGRNRVLGIVQRFPAVNIGQAHVLNVYRLGAQAMRELSFMVSRHRGTLSFLSLRGVKDIVLQSTGAPMPLLHVQHGPLAAGGLADPVDGAVHMICAPDGDILCRDLEAAGVPRDATATVIAHRMDGFDWRWVLTSEI